MGDEIVSKGEGVAETPKKRILHVDDNDLIRSAMQRTIRGIGRSEPMEIEMKSAESVKEAMRIIQGGFDPDVILSDMMIPDPDDEGGLNQTGKDFLERLKKDYPVLAGRLCFVSGGTQEPDLQALVDNMRPKGRMIDKPFDIHQIRDVIRSILEQNKKL